MRDRARAPGALVRLRDTLFLCRESLSSRLQTTLSFRERAGGAGEDLDDDAAHGSIEDEDDEFEDEDEPAPQDDPTTAPCAEAPVAPPRAVAQLQTPSAAQLRAPRCPPDKSTAARSRECPPRLFSVLERARTQVSSKRNPQQRVVFRRPERRRSARRGFRAR